MSEATGEGEISEQLHQQIGKQTSEASGSIIGEVIGSPGAEAGIVRLRGSDESGDAGQATAQLGETCPNFSRLIRGVSDFATRLLELKNSAPVSFRWYLYHTLPNLEHIEPLITPDYDWLFQPTKQYADIGCADGDLAYYLELQGNKLHLYDCASTNGNQLLGARYLKTALRSAVEITEVDLDTQFQIDGEYDVLFFLGILYHLKNPFYVLERLSHVSRFMLLSTRIARHFYSDGADVARVPATYLLAPDECNDDPTNFWIFTEAGLKRLAERTGWDAVRFRTVGDNLHSNPQDKDHDERAFVLLRSRRRC